MVRQITSLMTASAVFFCGCTTRIGPGVVHEQRFLYNEHIIRSQNEQMLLNLVRLRYNDTPLFLELNSIVTQYSMDNSANLSTLLNLRSVPDAKPQLTTNPSLSLSQSFAERPTVSYTPLQGEAFARQILTPIPPETIILLSQSGWSIARLMLLCVQRMNGIENAVTATGPTPAERPVFEQFQEVINLFQTLQKSGILAVGTAENAKDRRTRIIFRGTEDPAVAQREDLRILRDLLGLAGGINEFRLTISPVRYEADEIALDTRSLLGVLFFLAQAVDAPEEHRDNQLAAVSRDLFGNIFDWSDLLGRLMYIHSSRQNPADAFAAVFYSDYWFYIRDSDFISKATFNLLSYLFALQSAESRGISPLLSLSAGA